MKERIKNKKAVGYLDSAVKILIAVVIGTVVLGGTYTLTKDTVIATAKEKIEALFDYQGQTTNVIAEEPDPVIFSFRTPQGTFNAEEGMTWGEWVNSEYNTSYLSVIGSNHIGRESSDGSKTELYFNQNGKKSYVNANDLIDTSKYYQNSITTPIIWF